MSRLTVRRAEGERGAFIVVWAVLAVALLIMVAIVIDLGQIRSVRRTNQSVADFSALAAGDSLRTDPATACSEAFKYVKGNLTDFPTSGVTSPCNVLGSAGGSFPTSCGTSTPTAQDFVATGASPYTVTFRYPVEPGDITDSHFSGTGVNDGDRCERFKVTIAKTTKGFFTGVVGETTRTTRASAVMRSVLGNPVDVPSLWLLDPHQCPSLSAGGGSSITVGQASPPIAGLVTIDSDGQTPGGPCSTTTISVSGSGNTITALPSTGTDTRAISLYALPSGATTCQSPACNPGDVNSGRISPQPESRSQRATRAPIDWAFNCKTDLDGPGNTTSIYPAYHTDVFIDDCPNASVIPPYIDQLRTAIGTSGTPTGFTLYPGSCNPGGTQTYTGNYYVNCNTFSVGNGTNITFNGNVVFQSDVKMTGGALSVNTGNTTSNLPTGSPECRGAWDASGNVTVIPVLVGCTSFSSQNAAFVYQRNGDISETGGTLTMNHTMLYQNSGAVKVTGGSPPSWTAPMEGPFNKLSLWSEVGTDFTINGGGSLQLEGTYFAPEANPFKLTGGGVFPSLNAQFIARSLAVSGGSSLTLVPNASRNIKVFSGKGVLIR